MTEHDKLVEEVAALIGKGGVTSVLARAAVALVAEAAEKIADGYRNDDYSFEEGHRTAVAIAAEIRRRLGGEGEKGDVG